MTINAPHFCRVTRSYLQRRIQDAKTWKVGYALRRRSTTAAICYEFSEFSTNSEHNLFPVKTSVTDMSKCVTANALVSNETDSSRNFSDGHCLQIMSTVISLLDNKPCLKPIKRWSFVQECYDPDEPLSVQYA